MDQPTPDPTSPPGSEPAPRYAHWPETPPDTLGEGSPGTPPEPNPEKPMPPSVPLRPDATLRRLQSRIETTDPIIAWTKAWVSREMRLHGVLAARTLDFAVLTDRGVFLISTGFFTRRPRRCVYAARLDEIIVSRRPKGRGVRLRFASRKGRPLWVELRSKPLAMSFADALLARTRTQPS
jgi:hypothetical protein